MEHSDETGILTVEEMKQLKPYLERAFQTTAEGFLLWEQISQFLNGLKHCTTERHCVEFI
jgi:hypothetical protein